MSSDEIKLILMSVGLTVAVISLGLTIRNRLVDKKRSLKVSYTPRAMLLADEARYAGVVISIFILNDGSVPAFVSRPFVITPIRKDGFNRFDLVNFRENTNYPVKLEPGQEHCVEFDIVNFLDNFSQIKWYRRVRFGVRDSLGKDYLSKKVWFKKFIQQGELHRQLMKSNA